MVFKINALFVGLFPLALEPKLGLGCLFFFFSFLDHTQLDVHTSGRASLERMIDSSQRLLLTQHTAN